MRKKSKGSGRVRKKKVLRKSVQLTDEEKDFRAKLYPDVSEIKSENLKCTICLWNIVPPIFLKRSSFRHVVLDVLVCETCLKFYGDGDFSADEDGDDKYCRWCGQGGKLYCCSSCSCAFCKKCVKQNMKRSEVDKLEREDWKCFICRPKPLFLLRAKCWAVQEYLQNEKKVKISRQESSKRKHSTSSEDTPKQTKKKDQSPAAKRRQLRTLKSSDDSSGSDEHKQDNTRKTQKKEQSPASKRRRLRTLKSSDDSSSRDEHKQDKARKTQKKEQSPASKRRQVITLKSSDDSSSRDEHKQDKARKTQKKEQSPASKRRRVITLKSSDDSSGSDEHKQDKARKIQKKEQSPASKSRRLRTLKSSDDSSGSDEHKQDNARKTQKKEQSPAAKRSRFKIVRNSDDINSIDELEQSKYKSQEDSLESSIYTNKSCAKSKKVENSSTCINRSELSEEKSSVDLKQVTNHNSAECHVTSKKSTVSINSNANSSESKIFKDEKAKEKHKLIDSVNSGNGGKNNHLGEDSVMCSENKKTKKQIKSACNFLLSSKQNIQELSKVIVKKTKIYKQIITPNSLNTHDDVLKAKNKVSKLLISVNKNVKMVQESLEEYKANWVAVMDISNIESLNLPSFSKSDVKNEDERIVADELVNAAIDSENVKDALNKDDEIES